MRSAVIRHVALCNRCVNDRGGQCEVAMAKQQGKLTPFLTSSSGVAERELIDEECAADLQPATKRTKHRESGFHQSWKGGIHVGSR